MFKPGDLVMVVKPQECGCTHRIGTPATVKSTTHDFINAVCIKCGFTRSAEGLLILDAGFAAFPETLIKIDPPTEQDKTETLQEITA